MFKQFALHRKMDKLVRRLANRCCYHSIIEHLEVDFVLSRLVGQKKIRVLDVGAHYGEMIQVLGRATQRHHFNVICIEPLPSNLQILRRKAFRASLTPSFNIKVIPRALSNLSGVATFYVGSEGALVTNSASHMERFAQDFFNHQEIQPNVLKHRNLRGSSQCLSTSNLT